MTRPDRGPFSGALAISATAAVTTWAAMLSWRGFVEMSSPYLVPLLALGAVVALSGALGRWWRLPGYAVFAGQLLASVMALSLLITGNPIPLGAGWAALVSDFNASGSAAQAFASPVPADADPGVYPLLIAGGLACLLMVDLLACTLRRVPLAGLPLLTVYSLPLSMLGGGLSWWIFAATAAGFLALLYLHESEQISRWGRSLDGRTGASETGGFSVRTGSARGSAGTIGGAATALALVLPLAIPTLALGVFDFGAGRGGADTISVENPIADLRRDLRRDVDVPLVRVQTDDPNPAYLRISVLNRFRNNEWSSGDRDVPTSNVPDGAMPALEGVSSDIQRRSFDYDVSVTDEFAATWLPTQAPISSIDAPGDWRFDPRTRDFIASDDDLTTAGTSYSMTSVELQLTGDDLARARPSTVGVSEEYTELPSGTPDLARDLALEVTDDAESRFDKAVALQQWFRSEFTYSLERAESANGVDALESFLSPQGRVGYCEQFAASMSVMARTLGIPARVAVGFLRPQELTPGTWEYSAFDLHAWPELYFDGFGWVRFEPTPADRASGVPGYTRNRQTPEPPQTPTNQPTEQPQGRGADRPLPNPQPEPEAAPEQTGDDEALPWGLIGGGLGGGLLLVGLVLGPRWVRDRRRERALGAGPEGAWAELEATAVDLRVPWPLDRSPRETRDRLVAYFGSPDGDDVTPERPARGPTQAPEAVDSLDRLVHEIEILRYAADRSEAADLRSEVESVSAALVGGATPRVQRRARWLPPSLFAAGIRGRSGFLGDGSEPLRSDGMVEHLS